MRVNTRQLKNVGQKIQKARKKAELTQEELAERIGVSSTYVGFIEQGQRVPSIKTADKISRVLGIKLSELFD
ncbi:MAG: helix-turn-helix transcriptional regulator [Patescibacteria group bacterium]|nr:helix-turn-helix transcriptional regulator [Patescibacteria group bacterium]MCL5432231.1 helix-turn-helix transcriptional regulator [Patescibacteria group bacterium]